MNPEDRVKPLRIINAVAPIRICDNGGWTDTWFAGRGRIFNIGVYPYAEVQIEVFPLGALSDRIVIYAEHARVLTRRRTYPSRNFRHIVGSV